MANSDATERMRDLIKQLNEAAFSYYVEDKELISNFEYDRLYDELSSLERETGTVLPGSPTQDAGAGYRAVSKLAKSEHEYPALSLDKTKDRDSLASWLGGMEGVLSWKLDGLTVVLTYNGGRLEKAVTRGNGFVGEDVTHNVVHFGGIPKRISYGGKLIVRGEAVMKYADFEKINREMPDTDAKYKNPRNLASATVRLLDAGEAAKRPVTVCAFDLVYIDDRNAIRNGNSKSAQLDYLEKLGFTVVGHTLVTPLTVASEVGEFERAMSANEFPTDGLVLIIDDEKYGKSLGSTGKFPRNGIAFKWQDESVETRIVRVEWSASRTGLLNPVAVFDPVEIEGTTVSRASVHNLSIARSLRLGKGSAVSVYKANLIIPQISETVSSTGETQVPEYCPVCGSRTAVHENDGIETLYCENPDCPAKHIGRFSHFVSRDAMNIMGLSEATLETFIDAGYVRRFSDLYHLDRYRERIVSTEGFGEKSYENIIGSVESSRKVRFSALLNAVGIPGIGKDMAKQISRFIGRNAFDSFVSMIASGFDFSAVEGVGAVINGNIYEWSADNARYSEFTELASELTVSDDPLSSAEEGSSLSPIAGKTVVITGSLNNFANREELVSFIEERGGRTSGSVSAKTDYLINNDISSSSGKNKKAKELGIPIISEEDFLSMCGQR